jgi:hypothetical protein
VAAHAAIVATMADAMLPGCRTESPLTVVEPRVTTLRDIADLNDATLHHFTERDPDRLAEQLLASVCRVLRVSSGLDPLHPVCWLGGIQLPLHAALAHLLNELLLHGYDIARAAGQHWEIAHQDAAAVFDQFIVALFSAGAGAAIRSDSGPADRVAVRFQSSYTTPTVLVADRGRFRIEPADHPVDAHVRFLPAPFMLMLFGRVSKLRNALTGNVLVWGRRPWLLPSFFGSIYVP